MTVSGFTMQQTAAIPLPRFIAVSVTASAHTISSGACAKIRLPSQSSGFSFFLRATVRDKADADAAL